MKAAGDFGPSPKRDSTPVLFNVSDKKDRDRIARLFEAGDIKHTVDEYESQLRELYAINNPSVALTPDFKKSFNEYFKNLSASRRLEEQGVWAYFPWLFSIVHILGDKDFQKVRTARNKNLITAEEQEKFYNATIGIAGLSVGNSVALAIAIQGGGRRIKLADHDSLELSNLNRIRSGVDSLGLPKVEVTARQIYELNPYARVELFPDGLSDKNMRTFLEGLTLVVDEIDSLPMKYRIREEAKKYRIPVLMGADNGDSSVVDIERYDLDPMPAFFNGRIQGARAEVESLDKKETGALIANFVGFENHSERMLGSLSSLIGSALVSWPQLGGTALMNGSAVAYAARKITQKDRLRSGRYSIPLEDVFSSGTASQTDSGASFGKQTPKLSSELETILNAACQAPSADNTQPWKVIVTGPDTFSLHHVPERDMTRYDTGQRTSYMSHGAFLENVNIASAYVGRQAEWELTEPSPLNDWRVATITIAKRTDRVGSSERDLYQSIFKRVTNRKPYKKQGLPDRVKRAFLETSQQLGWGEVQIADHPQHALARAAAISGQIMFQNAHVHKGLFEHIRWTAKEAEATKDGFLIDTFELPLPAKLIFKLAQSSERLEFLNNSIQLSKNIPIGMTDLYEHSGAYIALISKKRTFEDYILLGRLMERVWLTAAKEGIALQPIGAICFFKDMLDARTTNALPPEEKTLVEDAYAIFEKTFSTQGKHILFLFRAGVADEPSARTHRLPLSHIVEERKK